MNLENKENGSSAESETNFENDSWVLDTRREALSGAMSALIERLSALGWSEEDLGLFPVAFMEAVGNAEIHGNLGIRKEDGESMEDYNDRISAAENSDEARMKKIRVELKLTADDAEISVCDEGFGFSPESVPDPTRTERLLNLSGRGVDIIKKACDRAEFFKGKTVLYKKKRT